MNIQEFIIVRGRRGDVQVCVLCKTGKLKLEIQGGGGGAANV